MTEIKYRGYLTQRQLEQITSHLNKNGKLIGSGYEQVVYFDTSIFPKIGDFATGFSRVSLKVDKNKAIFRIKDGDPSDARRNEITVAVRKKDCQNLVFILNHLGLKNGYYRPVYRQDFIFKKMIISIKTKCVMGNHFEIELPDGVSIKDPRIVTLLKKFSLVLWSKNQYQRRIHDKMKKFPAVNVCESNILGRPL